jgi:hypothetical protein
MYNVRKRVDRIERKFFPPERPPHVVNIGGLEMMSDELLGLLEGIARSGKSRGLPTEEEYQEYMALCAGDTAK